jgi:hypothetical protein
MRPPRPGAANCGRSQSFVTASRSSEHLTAERKKITNVTLRCNFSNYCDHRRDFRLWRNRGNICVDCPCPVRDISRAVCDFAAIQRKAIRLARKNTHSAKWSIAQRSPLLAHRLAYNGDIAVGQLAVFQGGPSRTGSNEAPISELIRAERATRKNSQLATARRVALKMGRRPRCSSVTYPFRYAPSSHLAGGPF